MFLTFWVMNYFSHYKRFLTHTIRQACHYYICLAKETILTRYIPEFHQFKFHSDCFFPKSRCFVGQTLKEMLPKSFKKIIINSI